MVVSGGRWWLVVVSVVGGGGRWSQAVAVGNRW